MEWIGHRGVAGLEPENTLRSIRRAFAMGLQMVEIDVRAVEGRLILSHDARADRCTDGVGGLEQLGLEKLRELNAGKGEKIPYLDEVIEILPEGCVLNIEIKGGGVVELLALTLGKMKAYQAKVIVSCFDWEQLSRMRDLLPDVKIAVLSDGEEPWEMAEKLGACAVNPSIEMLDQTFVQHARKRRLKVYSYTIKTPEQLTKAQACGVDGIFVDDPVALGFTAQP